MTNSREMAEQAFALLQNALEESESQRKSLEQKLSAPYPGGSEIEQQYGALKAELEALRADRDLWKTTSNQLQDVVSNERSKTRRLQKKLKVAESGSDRMSRKEINFWREKAEEFEAAKHNFQQRIHELKIQLNQRDEQHEIRESQENQKAEIQRLEASLSERDARITELNNSIETSRAHASVQERRIAELDTEVRSLSQQVIDAEAARNEACRAADQIDAELKDLRAQASAHQQTIEAMQQAAQQESSRGEDYRRRVEELESQHDREITALREEQTKELDALRTEHEQALESAHGEKDTALESLRTEHEQTLESLRDTHESALAQAKSAAADELREELETRASQLQQELDGRTQQLTEAQSALEALQSETQQQIDSTRSEYSEQVSQLETELAEERNRSDNLNELANERREALTKTTEKLEEMQERYEDAQWQLGKASHFEKLVRRRKVLIANLIKTIRARHKANNTLKAGLDSLRRYKANADERQQELLRRVEILENSLNEAREKLAQANQSRRVSDTDQPADNVAQSSEHRSEDSDTGILRSQVQAQAEVIENLEADLKSARIAENDARTKLRENEKLHDDLETKNTFIGSLQKDMEEQQKALAKLRKRDIEVRELRNKVEELERQLVASQQENNELRNAKNGEIDAIDKKKIGEQEKTIAKLTAKLREYEGTITTLSEAADSWKRKYDFLSAETPYAYESANTSK